MNKQQVDRKRHIGNDVITIIFQEPGAAPFSPAESGVRSQFQHIFVIVRAHVSKSSEEGTSQILTYYVIEVLRNSMIYCNNVIMTLYLLHQSPIQHIRNASKMCPSIWS